MSKAWTWAVAVGGLIFAYYLYKKQEEESEEQTGAIIGAINANSQYPSDPLGLTVSGISTAGSLVNSFSNLFSSSPSVSSGSSDTTSADMGSTSDYYTDDSSMDDSDDA